MSKQHDKRIECARLMDVDSIAWLLHDLEIAKRTIAQLQSDHLKREKQLQAEVIRWQNKERAARNAGADARRELLRMGQCITAIREKIIGASKHHFGPTTALNIIDDTIDDAWGEQQ